MSDATVPSPLRVTREEDGQVLHVLLDRPKGNVIDAAMTGSLREVFAGLPDEKDVKAVLIEGSGNHFSFGASVEEHRPDAVAGMLAAFHDLFRTMSRAAVACLAVVRGQCLGGGLELASFCHRVFASPDAHLGQPEIRLGVIAPAASVLLPGRVGRANAERLCLGGEVIGAEEALAIGLVDVVDDDPGVAARTWARRHLLPHSAAALRHAVRAVRWDLDRRLREDLAGVERLYLDDLMSTEDAVEGIDAFLAKRPPSWSNR